MNRRFLCTLALSASLGFAGPVLAEEHSHSDHAGHAHGAASFDAGEPGAGRKITRRVEVVAREGNGKMLFEPAQVAVKKGETIEFVVRNEGQLEHELVLGSAIENATHAATMEAMPDMKHDDPNAVRVKPGTSARLVWTFSKRGHFEFACLIPGHYDAGMKGDAVVD